MILKVCRGYGSLIYGNISRRFITNLTTLPNDQRNKRPENIAISIKSSKSFQELFQITSSQRNQMNGEYAMLSLRTMFILQKSGSSPSMQTELIKNSEFEHICQTLKKHSRTLSLNDVIDALKILFYFGLPSNSTICSTLLHLIRYQINDVTLGHISFLDFLLNKCESTPLVDALKLALPMLLQIQLGTKMDHENQQQLTELLMFTSKYQVSEQCIMNIISALTMHGDRLTVIESKSILRSLCDLRLTPNIQYEKLLQNCINILCDNIDELTFIEMESTLSHLTDKYLQKFDRFYNDRYWNLCADYVVGKNESFLNAMYLQRKFAKINFISLKLLEHICKKLAENIEYQNDLRPTALITIVNGLSMANYKPNENWPIIEQTIRQNTAKILNKNELPWIRFTVELLSLDIVDKDLLAKILSRQFLETFLTREYNTLDLLQLLTIWQTLSLNLWPNCNDFGQLDNLYIDRGRDLAWSSMSPNKNSPLGECVRHVFGGERYVYNTVKTKYGHLIEHLIIFDENCIPMECKNESELNAGFFENFNIPEGCKVVGITSFPSTYFGFNVPRLKGMFDLKRRTIEKLGIPLVIINLKQWNELLDHEKMPYIEREVRYKL